MGKDRDYRPNGTLDLHFRKGFISRPDIYRNLFPPIEPDKIPGINDIFAGGVTHISFSLNPPLSCNEERASFGKTPDEHTIEFTGFFEDTPHPVVRDMAPRIIVNMCHAAGIKTKPGEDIMFSGGNLRTVDYPTILNDGPPQMMDPKIVKKLLWDTTFHKVRSKKGPRRVRIQRIVGRSKTARLLDKYKRGVSSPPPYFTPINRGLTTLKVTD